MNALLVEDEKLAVRKLQKRLNEVLPNLNVSGVMASIEDTVVTSTHQAVDQIQPYFGNGLALTLKPVFDKEALISREKCSDFNTWMGK